MKRERMYFEALFNDAFVIIQKSFHVSASLTDHRLSQICESIRAVNSVLVDWQKYLKIAQWKLSSYKSCLRD